MTLGTPRIFPSQWHAIALSMAWLRSTRARFFLTTITLVTACTSLGQTVAHPQLQGTVRDSAGTPIATASVLLEQESSRAETKTNQDGTFSFRDISPAPFKLQVDKAGYCTLVTDPVPVDGTKPLNLVLTKSESGGRNCSAQSARANLNVELQDTPTFTIAGIKDWSGAGGHGSDTTLPTSERLTRDLATKPTPSSQRCPANRERELRADLAKSPESFDANHQLGSFYLVCNRVAEAIPFLESASGIEPNQINNLLQLARAYRQAGNLGQARTKVSKLLARGENADAHRLLGDIDEAQNDPLAAVREYERATHLEANEQNYFAWGTELLLHRAVQPAIEVFTKATDAHPRSARLLSGLGAALYASGAYDDAAKRICAASELNAADDAPYLFLGTMQKSIHKQLPCALDKLARFVEQRPNDALANFYYAMALWKKSRRTPDGADAQRVESLLKRAVALNPRLGEAYLQLGMLYSAQNHFDPAVTALKKAIDTDSTLSEAHYELGLACKRIGHDADARREFQLYAQVQKANTEAAEQRRREVRQFVVALADGSATTPPR